MIDDENHPLMHAAVAKLGDRLSAFVLGKRITPRLMHEVDQLIYDFRSRAKASGLAFPPVVALATPPGRPAALAFFRADLDIVGIRGAVVWFARQHPDLSSEDVAWAVRRAWPHIRPNDLVDEARFVVSADAGRMH